MVEAPRPIHRGSHFALRHERRSQPVRDAVVFIDHLDYRDARDRPQVEGLSAGSRIEGAAVQVHGLPVGRSLHDARFKFAQIRVRIVEAFCHLIYALLWQVTANKSHAFSAIIVHYNPLQLFVNRKGLPK